MEGELQQSEERYRKLINSARDVIFTISMDGRITSLNPSFEIFTGWPRADWLGRAFDELVAEDDRNRAHDQFNRILHGETLRALRLRMHTRTGDALVVEMNISPQFNDEHVIGLLGIARDMTQEQQAEDALKASEKRFAPSSKMGGMRSHSQMYKAKSFMQVPRPNVCWDIHRKNLSVSTHSRYFILMI
jgi:PAS domain S-box-containing protein